MPDVQSIKKQLHMQQWTAIIEDRIASGLKIDCIFRKNCASVPEERSAIPLQTEQSSAG